MRIHATKYYIFLVGMIFQTFCLLGQDFYTLSPATFNTKDYEEFCGKPFKEGFVFCSNRTQNVFIARVDSNNRPLLDLYYTRKKPSGRYTSVSMFMKEVSSRKQEGPFCFSKDQNTIYFTRNEGHVNGIFISNYNGSIWSQPVPFQYNEPNADVGHPYITSDGQYLLFSSNKAGGYGGFDIYICEKTNGIWGQPKNLGPEINTSADETYPFLHSNGRLYFTSNRKGGFGGQDIYFSRKINGKWKSPRLMPAPINSKGNDFAYWSDSTDRQGNISTDRMSHIELSDIYEFKLTFPSLVESTPQKKNKYDYEFYDESNINTDTTALRYQWDFGDSTKVTGRSLDVDHTFAKTGIYVIKLNIVDTITGIIYRNQATYSFPVTDIEQPFITCQDTVYINEPVSLNAKNTYLPDKNLLKYYWNFGDDCMEQGILTSHTYTELGTYRVNLCISFTLDKSPQIITECRYKDIIVMKRPNK